MFSVSVLEKKNITVFIYTVSEEDRKKKNEIVGVI